MTSAVGTEASSELIFRRRAKALAAEPPRGQPVRPSLDAVAFQLAHETYAVESIYVREVLPLRELTPLPSAPAFVLGLANVRGQILSVIDLRVLFDLPRKESGAATKLIVLRAADMEVGVLADAVAGALSVPLDEIRPALPTMTGFRERCLRGIGGESLVILAANRLLADEAIVVNQQAEGGD